MTDIVDKLRSLPPREICEHGSQKVKCPICELAEAYEYIELLEHALWASLYDQDVVIDCAGKPGKVEFVEIDDDSGRLMVRRER